MAKVNIKINSKQYSVDSDQTVLQVCRKKGIDIPTLCYNEQLAPYGSCFLCTVELKGSRRKFNLSCATQVMDGMEIITDSEDLWNQRIHLNEHQCPKALWLIHWLLLQCLI